MNKRIIICLAAVCVIGSAFCAGSNAATVSVNVVSVANVPVYGPSATDFFGAAPSGVTPGSASVLGSVPSGWPQASSDPSLVGAAWITTPTPPADTAVSYSLFQDSFTPPCTASNLAGTLYTAANNAETVYFNQVSIGSTQDSGTNPPLPVVGAFAFVPAQGENTFDFDVTRDVPTNSVANPIGLIYNAAISFTLPDVVWRPPIAGTGRTILKNGTTLPIKFVLRTNTGVLRTVQKVYLSITGPSGEVVRFNTGNGLMFAPGNGQYHADFHTKNFDLTTGVQYTVSVNDSCSGTSLGSITIQMHGKTPHGKK